MSWKFVFNSNLLGHYGDIDKLYKIVIKTGYEFFIHNGIVYYTDGNFYSSTSITTEDLF